MVSLWNIFQSKFKVTNYPTITPAIFTIPEILEQILSYLSPQKRGSVALAVCRQWYAICLDMEVFPPSLWSLKMSATARQHVIDRLPDTVVLRLWPQSSLALPIEPERPAMWAMLMNAIRVAQQKQQQQHELLQYQQQNEDQGEGEQGLEYQMMIMSLAPRWKQLPYLPLQELDLKDEFTAAAFLDELLPLLYKFECLSTLRLQMTDRPDRVLLHGVLRASPPSLQNLHVKVNHFRCQSSDIQLHNSMIRATHCRERAHPLRPLPTMHRLKTLDVQYMILSPGAIESILEASPNLQELRIFQAYVIQRQQWLSMGPTSNAATTTVDFFHQFRFLQWMMTTCSQLRCLHFSDRKDKLSKRELDLLLLEIQLPHLTEWSFPDQEVEIPLLGGQHLGADGNYLLLEPPLRTFLRSTDPLILQRHHHRLTRLELLRTPREDSRGNISEIRCGGALHQFLYQARHLQHLIATRVVIDIEDMDLNGVLKSKLIDFKGKTLELRRQERQQRLQLQHLDSLDLSEDPEEKKPIWACRGLQTLHVTFNNDRNLMYPSGIRGHKLNSLIIFGYLSRFCPSLKDIYLRRWCSEISKNSGFCLLSRLYRLERLVLAGVKLINLKSKNLKWMRHPYYRTYSPGADSDHSSLGLAAELKKWSKDDSAAAASSARAAGGCWPELEYFKIEFAYGATPEQYFINRGIYLFMQQIWPDAKVKFDHLTIYHY
ncbi:hypothetical protein EDD11_002455 [Mortierella claussenii]|nr:hypothetical protein EDD11_002455 [Mortierella claussenii]